MLAAQSSVLFTQYLLPHERVLWTGQPRHGFALSPADLFLIPFSLMWCGFVVFWNLSVWQFDDPPTLFFKLFGLGFLGIGLYFVVGRFAHDALIRRHLHYAVTDQRILIYSAWPTAKLRALDIRHLPMLDLEEGRDGRGTINFESGQGFGDFLMKRNFSVWTPSAMSTPRFFKIEQVRKVYSLIANRAG